MGASTKDQGFYFGLMQGFFALGTSGTGMIVGPSAESTFDIPIFGETRGWRIAFALVSCVAIVASLFSFLFMPDVPALPMTQEEKQQDTRAVMAYEFKAMIGFLRYPSFVLMIVQGMFGTIPWMVLGNINLYVRLCGFPQWTLFWLGLPGVFAVLGGLLGGAVSDQLCKKFGLRGRPLTAMISVGFGIPLRFMLWYGIPPGSPFNEIWTFFTIQTLVGLLASWAQPGCNFPVLGQIVTGKDRNKVMCWETTFETTIAMIISSNAVPLVTKLLGYDDIRYIGEPDLEQARALGAAQAIMVCIPWSICFCVYSGLLWSFPLDVKRVEAEKAEEEARAVDDMELVAGAVAPASSFTVAS